MIDVEFNWLSQDNENGARAMYELLNINNELLLRLGLFWEFLPRQAIAVYILISLLEEKYAVTGEFDKHMISVRTASGDLAPGITDAIKLIEEDISEPLEHLLKSAF